MPNRSKEKGDRFEREILHQAEELGLKGFRNRMSRAYGNEQWDLSIAGTQFEVKKRGNGFKQFYKWLNSGADGLIIGADHEEPLVILRLKDYLKLR